ncbi:tRNA (adenosine(37)-N6)-dimethylallyltransferase MiaA [Porphyromonas uenonis]|uniref:tRNA (adenosine(37)-N6)-dimethylallyltransferase MiaA n=1 Tax=Porphyromonas uenonis TaxID=281920 RepID=UPI000472B090|nr:tRNA (adenosine(37)-N6)-dimethylallyltransferase MiaA [Porphyromonas uenonis]
MYYPELLTVVGPTACGKTALGVALAEELHGAILSGDSRQVFVGMDIGTGKDLDSYTTERGTIPYYLIDIVPAGQPFNLFEYVRLFDEAYHEVVAQQLKPIFVGGSGLYVEQVLQTRPMHQVPPDAALREELELLSLDDLRAILSRYPRIDRMDPSSARKCIRAIEIARHYAQHPEAYQVYQQALREAKRQKPPLIIGLRLARQEIIRRIDQRLQSRLEGGMVAEVERLLDQHVPAETLIAYGLEYRFITFYLQGKLSYSEMEKQLATAIHQFAKRQMTWFRGMSRRGLPIHWIDGHQPVTYQRDRVLRLLKSL